MFLKATLCRVHIYKVGIKMDVWLLKNVWLLTRSDMKQTEQVLKSKTNLIKNTHIKNNFVKHLGIFSPHTMWVFLT